MPFSAAASTRSIAEQCEQRGLEDWEIDACIIDTQEDQIEALKAALIETSTIASKAVLVAEAVRRDANLTISQAYQRELELQWALQRKSTDMVTGLLIGAGVTAVVAAGLAFLVVSAR